MPPALIAFFIVAALGVVFWSTRNATSGGKRWGTRLAAAIVLYFVAAVLSADAPAAARAGQLTVYFLVPGVVLYLVLGKWLGGRG